MDSKGLLFFKVIFILLCFVMTIFMVTKCFLNYIRNEDVCLVSFKRFNDNADQIYPTTTLCISNPIQKEKLEIISKGLYNTSSYTKQLQGHYMGEIISDIGYDEVTVDINEHLVDYKVLFPDISRTIPSEVSYKDMASFGQNGWNGPYTSFRKEDIKCFSFDIPFNRKANILGVTISLNSSIFHNDTRPDEFFYDTETPGISLLMHMKSQMMLSFSTMKTQWNTRNAGSPKHYKMQFEVNNMDMVTYRSKKHEPCHEDWQNYDEIVFQDIISRVGCQVEYWNMTKMFPYCTKREELEKVDLQLIEVFANNIDVVPPCKTIKQAQFEYKDVEYKVDPFQPLIDIVLDFKNLNHHFKEIRQVQAYTSESLIGTGINLELFIISVLIFLGIQIHI